jgi:hypothetical protein
MRTLSLLAAGSLVAATLTAGLVSASPASAGASDFQERWCTTGGPRPCLESVTRDTGSGPVPVTESDPDWKITSTGKLATPDFDYFMWTVDPRTITSGGPELTTGQTWSLTFDTGTLQPDYTEAYAGKQEVTRTDDGDGTYHVTYTAQPVITTSGCASVYPPTCPYTADSWAVQLTGEVHDLAPGSEFNGFDVAQSADEVNGIFLEGVDTGKPYLESEMANSHQYDSDGAGTMVTFVGQVRWSIPYVMLKQSFGVDDPANLSTSGLSGTVSRPDGTLDSGATWVVDNRTTDKVLVVDVSGLTFTRKILRLRRGDITPTRPSNLVASRTGRHTGVLDFDASRSRGSRVTGYAAACDSVGGGDGFGVASSDTTTRLRLSGLKARTAYDCKVRALSKAGPGRWTATVRMPARG